MSANNSEVAHNWAHQLKEEQYGSNLHFSGCKIYSYSTVIGEVVKLKSGETVYFLNTGDYSVSTRRHQSCVDSAIPVGAKTFSVSCHNFKLYYDGITSWKGELKEFAVVQFIVEHLKSFYDQLLKFKSSKSLRDQTIFTFMWYDEAEKFIALFNTTTIKQLLRKNLKTMESSWKIKNPSAFRKVINAVMNGERSLSLLVDLALGDGAWNEYVLRTNGIRKAQQTKKLNFLIGCEPQSSYRRFYVPYSYSYRGRSTHPKNPTYIGYELKGVGKGFTSKQLDQYRKNGNLLETLLEAKHKNFDLACAANEILMRRERRRDAKGRLERYIGLRGFQSSGVFGKRPFSSFNYNGVEYVFQYCNKERPLTDEEYIAFGNMSREQQKQFIFDKRAEMLTSLQSEAREYELRMREYEEEQRRIVEERERFNALLKEKAEYINALKSTGDDGVRRLWHECLIKDSISYKPVSFFFGGNALLRVSLSGDMVETSKGIRVPIDECKRLWKIINLWHTNHKEFDGNIDERVHATNNDWAINRFQNDIMIAGCHAIAYKEMERVANQLGF